MSLAIATLSPVEAYEELMRFAGRFGEMTLRLAFHAAVPQSFRTDLLHLIKINFVPEAKDDYTVEADILLSPLCKNIGRGYFQFDPQVRLLLLDNLVKTYSAEKIPRLNRVANFILSYANFFNRTTSGSSDRLWKEYLETQRWVALAFINPESAATQFAECLQNSVADKDIVTRLQLSGLAASLSAPLAAYSQLVNYAFALQTAETNGHAEAAEKFGKFLEQEVIIGDIKLRPVSEIVQKPIENEYSVELNEESEDESNSPFDYYNKVFDVFISYGHTYPRYENASWVRYFEKALDRLLIKKLGLHRPPSIMCYNTRDRYETYIEEAIIDVGKSLTFVSIVTPDYVQSDYCQKELEKFCEEKVFIGTKSRLFKVVKNPVEVGMMPAILSRIKDFNLFEVDERTKLPRSFVPTSAEEWEAKFLDKVDDLANEIVAVLKVLRKEYRDEVKDNISSNIFFNVPDFSNTSLSANRKKLLEEIWNLFAELHSSEIPLIDRGINIVGTAGLGKTYLAAEYARHYRSKYPNGVYWLDAGKNLNEQISEIWKLNEWTKELGEISQQTIIEKYKSLDLFNCLFIVDGVENFDDIKNYLPPPGTKAHILGTSREKISEFYQIELKTFEFDESRILLLEFSNRTEPSGAENEHLHELVANIGGHPMSLLSIGTFLAENPEISFSEFNRLFHEISPEAIKLYLPADDHSEEDKISARLLKIGEKIFTNKYPSNDVLEILNWSSISGVGISLLSALVAAENASNLQDVLNEAINLNLARKNEQTGRYAPNPLLVATKGVENTLSDKKDWVEMIAERLLKWFEERAKISDDLTKFENESDNLLAWQRNLNESDSLTSINLDLLSAKWNRIQKNHNEAQKLAKNSLDKCMSLSVNQDERLLATIYNELWMINSLKTDYQMALEYILQELKILQNSFGESHPEIAECLDNIGQTFEMLNNFNEALTYYHRALDIKQRIFGERTPEIASSLEKISSIFIWLGRFEEALNYQQQALNIQEKAFGRNHHYVAVTLSNIGETYYRLGDYEQALYYQKQSFEILSKISESFEEIKIVQDRLILLLIRLEQFEEAENFLLKIIAGNNTTDKTYSYLGKVYKSRWEKLADNRKLGLQFLDKAIDAYLHAFEKDSDNYAGANAVTLMEFKIPPDPRQRDILPFVRESVEQLMASKTPDYWDFATLLELAVLAGDKQQSTNYAAKSLSAIREIWEPETTVRNLRLIREARDKRGEDTEWIKEIEEALSKKSK